MRTARRHLFFLICILSILFFIGGPDYNSPRSFKAIWNLGHIIYFALLPLLLSPLSIFQKYKPAVQAGLLLLGTIGLGVLVEVLQYGFSRSPDISDIYRDILGFFIAVVFFDPTGLCIKRTRLNFMRVIVMLSVFVQCIPAAQALRDESQARSAFPTLSDFQTAMQLDRWVGTAERTLVALPEDQANQAMRVVFSTAQYSGVNLKYFPGRWSAYKRLEFKVLNPGAESLNITCRIHDRNHNQEYDDRFNMTFKLYPGWNLVTIELDQVRQAPAQRQLDLDQVESVGIFTVRSDEPRDIIFDDLRLY